ncbi:hypothetical protein SAMN04488058_11739 [Deinococcus reticulitermitis]|uniref:Uncharacterized protein n=1 Tax=Deinococcus reticulitermitis TaxID=856736 RepID=A0A1H7BC59_9DEIO|nr:hypothetical protein SAMN04488058_11739 [Deinococcus reticulitermitis]
MRKAGDNAVQHGLLAVWRGSPQRSTLGVCLFAPVRRPDFRVGGATSGVEEKEVSRLWEPKKTFAPA